MAELDTAPVTQVTKSGEEQPLEEAFIAPPEPAAVAPEPAPAATEVAVAEPAPEPAPAELPATASPFYAIGLAGLMAAAAGLTLSRLAYRKS